MGRTVGVSANLVAVRLLLVAIQVIATVLACVFYNLCAELLGGIEVKVIQEDAPGKP